MILTYLCVSCGISNLQLKAFYVDFILPLENNIEKDTKVIHLEQKKFVQLHKQRVESFNKATSAMKKHRKKKNNAEKELKVSMCCALLAGTSE